MPFFQCLRTLICLSSQQRLYQTIGISKIPHVKFEHDFIFICESCFLRLYIVTKVKKNLFAHNNNNNNNNNNNKNIKILTILTSIKCYIIKSTLNVGALYFEDPGLVFDQR